MPDPTAVVRVILGDDPNTLEEDHPAKLVPLDNPDVTCVEVAGLGHVLYGNGRAVFTQGPGTDRPVDVLETETGAEITVVKNGRGQRRMVVVLENK